MALKKMLLFCVIVAASADQFKYLENYIFYNITGASRVDGVSSENVHRCLTKAMRVVENTISGLRLLSVEDAPQEEAKINFDFKSFGLHQSDIVPLPSETEINCTISRVCPTFRIHSSNINFNTDFKFFCKQFPENNGQEVTGIDLFQNALFELLHAFGLRTNDDNTSILYRHRDGFEYQTNGQLNDADRARVGDLYILRTPAKN